MTSSKLSRRELLKLSAGALLSMGIWPGRLAYAETPTENFSVAVLNDLHAMSPECGPWLEKIAADVRRRRPRFCVLAGDLTDKAEAKYMDLVHTIFKKAGCPVYVNIGNHDWVNDNDRSTFEKRFPDSLNYYFEEGGWQCIWLDTTNGVGWEKTYIGTDTIRWLDEVLPKLSRKAPTVVFTHFPLGAGVRMRPLNADELLNRFRGYNVQTVFSGHFHGYTKKQAGKTMLLTDRCCALKRFNHDGTKEKGYFIASLTDGRVEHEFIEIGVAPEKAAMYTPNHLL